MAISASYPVPEEMQFSINTCSASLGVVGLTAALVPHLDLAIIAPVWLGLTIDLGEKAGVHLEHQMAKKICMAVATGVISYVGGAKLATAIFGWLALIPSAGASLALTTAANVALNAKLTHAYGNAVARYFLQVEDLNDVDLAIAVLTALVAVQFGVPSPSEHVVA